MIKSSVLYIFFGITANRKKAREGTFTTISFDWKRVESFDVLLYSSAEPMDLQ